MEVKLAELARSMIDRDEKQREDFKVLLHAELEKTVYALVVKVCRPVFFFSQMRRTRVALFFLILFLFGEA